MIGCQATGEAIVVDPLRDVAAYARTAEQEGLRIVNVTETHIHADFVSGARELAALTGAHLLLSGEGGPDWLYTYAAADNAQILRDGDVFMVGNIRFEVMHTPGHTPEHLSFIVTDTPAAAGPMGILTGDFVFVGDVGRPDLLEKAAHVVGTMEASARTLYHSLQRFLALPDHLQVWPGHGAGSACGKALGAVPFSTVGYEKIANWGLNVADEQEFVHAVLEGQPDPPLYFANMKKVNKEGPRVLRGIVTPPKLPPSSVHALMKEKAMVIDLRTATAYAESHVPGTINIPYSKSFSTWAGWLIPTDSAITLIVDAGPDGLAPDNLTHAVRDLAIVGLDRVTGWMDQQALSAWVANGHALGQVEQLSATDFGAELASASNAVPASLIDVRNDDEWSQGHIPGATHIPLGHLLEAIAAQRLASDAPIVVQCQAGARSSIAASVLQREGFTNVRNLVGGFTAWVNSGQGTQQG